MRRNSLAVTAPLLASLLAAVAGVAGVAAATLGCAPAAHPGGDWPSYGHDLSNSRTQPLETTITPDTVAGLAAAWVIPMPSDAGIAQGTPIVADGCVYLGTERGYVIAFNADTGAVAWQQKLAAGVFSVAVADGRVYALVNKVGSPFAQALDQETGEVAWTGEPMGVYPGLRTNASAVVLDDILFFGYSVPEGDANAHAGWALVDTATGETLEHRYVIPAEDWQYGYGGGGIWTTAAIDPVGRYAYVGTSNPTSKKVEHPRTNAVLKIDLDRSRDTFGDVVDSNKGDFDQYYPGLDRQPACEAAGEDVTYLGFSVTCAQLDLDFGASPNLFTDDEGDLVLGILQKSGIYHAYYADTLHEAWTQVMAPPCFQCNFAATAADADRIYGVGTPLGQMVAMDQHRGGYAWVAPVGDGLHHQATSVAGGVVYTTDTLGFLSAFDAASGLPLLKHPISIDIADVAAGTTSNGLAIARNTIYASVGGFLIAYRI